MFGEPRDKTAYAIAIASLGLALALLLAGICWVAVQSDSSNATVECTHECVSQAPVHCKLTACGDDTTVVLDRLWTALAALSGVLVGALIPFSLPDLRRGIWQWDPSSRLVALIVAFLTGALILWANLLLLFAVGGLLLGLLIPSPASRD